MKTPPCKCCGKTDRTVKVRNRMMDHAGRTGPALCEGCWMDPHNKMADCQHGLMIPVRRIEADCYEDSLGTCMFHHVDHREEA